MRRELVFDGRIDGELAQRDALFVAQHEIRVVRVLVGGDSVTVEVEHLVGGGGREGALDQVVHEGSLAERDTAVRPVRPLGADRTRGHLRFDALVEQHPDAEIRR